MSEGLAVRKFQLAAFVDSRFSDPAGEGSSECARVGA